MKKASLIMCVALLCSFAYPPSLASADFFDDVLKKELPQLPGIGELPAGRVSGRGLDDSTIASGLKEALAIGTKNAVNLVSRVNGYYGNDAIKILLPDKIQKAAEFAGRLGYRKQVEEFIQSMNQAAERAAPKAASFFADAIMGMTIDDARRILSGGETSATEYFKLKTSSNLYDEFKPSISESMNQTGVVRSYNAMMSRIPAIPLAKPESVDLDHHITAKAVDGLFHMVGQEERKIRTNPAARTTELLTKVFGN
jgi:hypothetical protein